MSNFLDEFMKRAQMAIDPNMAMGAAPGAMPGMPPAAPTMGMPPVDPSMMGGQPPMDPAAMGGAPQPTPEDLIALMGGLQGAAPDPEGATPEGTAPENSEAEPLVPASLLEKSIEMTDKAIDLAIARGEEDLDALSTNAAGPMVASGAIDNLTPEEIMALKGWIIISREGGDVLPSLLFSYSSEVSLDSSLIDLEKNGLTA